MVNEANHRTGWFKAFGFALPAVIIVLVMDYRWFAVTDRYVVFLYYHDMGDFVPDTSPFSAVTASRYWMTGLILSGAVMVLYVVINSLLRAVVKGYRPVDWRKMWAVCAAALVVGIPLITMMANDPTLPLWNSIQVVIAALAGLALAFRAAHQVGEDGLIELLWLASDGWGLAWVASGITSIQFMPRWISFGGTRWIVLAGVVFVLGLGWLGVMSAIYRWRKKPVPDVLAVLLAGGAVLYLVLPLLHYVGFTDGYYYITNSDNFFSQTTWFQIVVWLIAGALVTVITRVRRMYSR